MKRNTFRHTSIVMTIILLQGCALFDKHLFNPAASHARVDPLFRTADCANYNAPDGGHWLSTLFVNRSTRNMSSIFTKGTCEYQRISIVEHDGTDTKKDPNLGLLCDFETSRTFYATNCINYLISKSDEICELHKSHIYGNRTAMNTLLGALALGSGIAGTMTGASAAHYLAGSAGFITGGQSLMNNEIYRNFVSNAILLEIDNNRKEFLQSLTYRDDNSKNNTVGYGKVRSDALKYHDKCSFYDGLTSLLNKAGDKAEKGVILKQFLAQKTLIETDIKDLNTKISNSTDKDERIKLQTDLADKEKDRRRLIEIIAALGGDITIKSNEQPSGQEKSEASTSNP